MTIYPLSKNSLISYQRLEITSVQCKKPQIQSQIIIITKNHITMFGCIRLLCCSGIPKSTSSDYYFDPRVATIGIRRFQPEKTRNIVSNDDFDDMREEMIVAGGTSRKMARVFYFFIWAFAFACFAWFVARIVLSATGTHSFKRVLIIISIVVTIVVNITLNRIWVLCMRKAAGNIQVLFEKKNKVYSKRGIYWSTNKTLSYIHIRIVAVKSGKAQGIALNAVKAKKVRDLPA